MHLLETRTRDILIKIVKSTCLVKQEEVRRAQEEESRRQRAREAEEQRRIEIEAQQQKQTLADHTADWHNAEQLRHLISIVEIVFQDEPAVEPRQLSKWLEWQKSALIEQIQSRMESLSNRCRS